MAENSVCVVLCEDCKAALILVCCLDLNSVCNTKATHTHHMQFAKCHNVCKMSVLIEANTITIVQTQQHKHWITRGLP